MFDDQPQHAPEGAPEWMVSYADMITIIMAFFVVLYASTSASGTRDKGGKAGEAPRGGKEVTMGKEIVDDPQHKDQDGRGAKRDPQAERMQRVFDSLYGRFGPEWTVSNCWSGGTAAAKAGPVRPGQREETTKPTGRYRNGAKHGDQASVLFVAKPNDSLITGGRLIFPENADTLDAEQKQQLLALAGKLAGKMQKLEIRGHTDSQPLPAESAYHDHLELAYARCRAVRDYLMTLGIDPRRIRLSAAGEFEPLETDGDPVRMRQNSRVDIHWLNEWMQDPAGPRGAGKTAAVGAVGS
jgi:chemotaxis protein MotB